MTEPSHSSRDTKNAKRERARRRAENDALVKIMSRLTPKELVRFVDRLLARYLGPRL